MGVGRVNRACGVALVVLSLVALVDVLIGIATVPRPPPTDEGTLARIFQLSIVLLAPAGLAYLATADWAQPWRIARPVAPAAVFTVLSFGALYYLEHLR